MAWALAAGFVPCVHAQAVPAPGTGPVAEPEAVPAPETEPEPAPESSASPEDATAPATPLAADDAVPVDTIVVTGSRIKKADYAFSNPVVTVDSDAIKQSGTVNVTDYLKRIPALTGSTGSSDVSGGTDTPIGGTGLELLNLRNLGSQRTLVLVDGRRHVAGDPGTAGVDVDTIPSALIENVEVSLGGASAIYGADGVSGVVNFVMKRDYDGLDLNVQRGAASRGDADTWLASAVAGHNFLDGNLNLTGAVEYTSSARLQAGDRSGFATRGRAIFVDNPDDPDDDPNLPDEIPLYDVRYFDSSRAGGIDTRRPLVNYRPNFSGIDADGHAIPWDHGAIRFLGPFYQQGGSGTRVTDYTGDLTPREQRLTVNTFATWEARENLKVFTDLKWSHGKDFAESQPAFDYNLLIPFYNPYLPPNVIADAIDNHTYFENKISISRDNFDLGLRGEDIDRDTLRAVAGLDQDITDSMKLEVSLEWGQSTVRNHVRNNRLTDRFAAALDAVDDGNGHIVCRSDLDPSAQPVTIPWEQNVIGGFNTWDPRYSGWAATFQPGPNSGCIPIDLTREGGISKEAAAWINRTTLDTAKIDQTVFQAFVSGEMTNLLVPGAPEMGYSVGIERRIEGSEGHPDFADQSGYTFGNVIQPSNGRYGVSEAFLELDVPVLKEKPFAEYFGVDGAFRLSRYSTVGYTQTWKFGGTWKPIDDVSFRGTRARATRAPNIGELFDPGGQTYEFIDDPCDVNNLGNGTPYRRANCEEILLNAGVADPSSYHDPNSSAVAGLSKGNPDLKEEDADTKTIGIVLQPRFAKGLSLSIDWYDITLANAINSATAQQIVDNCVDAPTVDNNFCALVERRDTNGGVRTFTEQPLNVAHFTTRGTDFNLSYRIDPKTWGATADYGVYALRIVGNHLDELTFINLPGAIPDIDKNEANAPEWQATLDLTWDWRALRLSWAASWFDRTLRFSNQTVKANPDIAEKKYIWYHRKLTHDVYARYELSKGLSVYGGVTNIGNEKPDIGETAYPVDPVGRAWYAGLEWEGTPF